MYKWRIPFAARYDQTKSITRRRKGLTGEGPACIFINVTLGGCELFPAEGSEGRHSMAQNVLFSSRSKATKDARRRVSIAVSGSAHVRTEEMAMLRI